MSIPEDLVEEILSRVPATSLKRLRSTCKQWNALFSNRRFTEKHLEKAPKELRVLMLANFRVYATSIINLRGIRNNNDQSIELKAQLGLPDDYNEIFHCKGLLLCTKGKIRCGGTRLVVYNPCTGQTKWIELTSVYSYHDEFALGYKNNKSCCDSYKILRFCCNDGYSGSVHRFEIYEFSSDSWKVLEDVTHALRRLVTKGRGVSLKGNTYWIAKHYDKLHPVFLLHFDFTEERFQRLPLPFANERALNVGVLSTVREEKLAVLYLTHFLSATSEIWLTNRIDEAKDVTWSMLFRVDLDIRYVWGASLTFMVDEENKIALCRYQDLQDDRDEDDNFHRSKFYIIGEDKFRVVDLVGESASQPGRWEPEPFLFSYAPSLVQI